MGAHESSRIQVTFNRSNSFYFAGDRVSGNILYQNTHDRLVLDEIFLEFIGELGYTTVDTHHYNENLNNSQPAPNTVYHRIPFENIRLSVAKPPHGQREIILNHGQNAWPFEFTLPKRLPPSIVPLKSSHPYVKYYVRITIYKPWYKPNTKHIYPLKIFPRVTLLHMYESLQPVSFSYFNRKKVHMDGRLLQTGIVPNQKLVIQINLQNPKQCVIKRIEIVLIRHHQVAQHHEEDSVIRLDLPGIHDFNGIELRRTFNIRITTRRLVPSYTFIAQFNHQTYPIVVKYELALKVKSHGMLTDFDVKIPVILGTELAPDPIEQQRTNAIEEIFMARASLSDSDELPPSYETVVPNTT